MHLTYLWRARCRRCESYALVKPLSHYIKPHAASLHLCRCNNGCLMLPNLLKWQQLIKATAAPSQDWFTLNTLPIPSDPQKSRVYHSVFTCPVTKYASFLFLFMLSLTLSFREVSDISNRPRRLPCGHVLSDDAVQNMVRGVRQYAKCPYCSNKYELKDTLLLKLHV